MEPMDRVDAAPTSSDPATLLNNLTLEDGSFDNPWAEDSNVPERDASSKEKVNAKHIAAAGDTRWDQPQKDDLTRPHESNASSHHAAPSNQTGPYDSAPDTEPKPEPEAASAPKSSVPEPSATSAVPPTEPPRLALVTDIQIPQAFEFPSSPPAAKPRYNSAVVDEFDPLAKSGRSPISGESAQEAPRTPVRQGRTHTPTNLARPQTPLGPGRPQTPSAPGRPQPLPDRSDPHPRPPTPTSAPATVATFPSIASIARSFISRPSSPVTTGRPELPLGSPKTRASPLPQSPATRNRPVQSSTLASGSTATTTSEPPDPEQFDFPRFLDQLKSRPADPVAKYLRSFSHNFAKKNFTVNDQIKLVHDFLAFISARMRECDVWKKANEVEFDNAVEGMEKLVMNRLFEFTFTPQIARSGRPVTTDDLERDRVLKQRIALFQWIRPEHLDIPMKLKEDDDDPVEENASPASAEKSADSEISMGFLLFAQQEMNKIDHYKAPRDKLICVLNSCKVIFGLIRHLRGDEGADSFIPLLIFVLIRANPEHLLSNIEYINRFRRASKLQSEAGYYLSSLMGAVSFIETMDHTSLSNITQSEFEKNVEQAIQELPPSPDPTSPTAPPTFISSRSTASDLSQLSSASASSSVGEESARTLQLPQVAAIAEDTRRFLERTGESLSKPLNAIGRIFSEVLDDEPRTPGSGYPGASGPPQAPYRTRPNVPNEHNQGLLPPLQFPNLGFDLSNPTTPNSQTPPRAPTPLDFSAMEAEIDRAHAAAADAARTTLHQIFPTMDREITDMVLEANNGDLGLSIDKLLEMTAS